MTPDTAVSATASLADTFAKYGPWGIVAVLFVGIVAILVFTFRSRDKTDAAIMARSESHEKAMRELADGNANKLAALHDRHYGAISGVLTETAELVGEVNKALAESREGSHATAEALRSWERKLDTLIEAARIVSETTKSVERRLEAVERHVFEHRRGPA